MQNRPIILFKRIKQDFEGTRSLSKIIGIVFTIFILPVLGQLMNIPKISIFSVAVGLTIIIWIFAFQFIRHLETPSNNLEASKKTTLSDTLNIAESESTKVKIPAPIKSIVPKKNFVVQKESEKAKPQPPPIEKLTFVSQDISSSNEKFPYGLQLTIQTNTIISPAHLKVFCTEHIGDANFSFTGIGIMQGVLTTLSGNTFEFSCAFPTFTPQNPIVVTIFSASNNKIIKVIHIY